MSAGVANDRSKQLAEVQAALAIGEADQALSIIAGLPPQLRNNFEILSSEADALGRVGRHAEELAILKRLAEREPNTPSLHITMAHALKTLGRREEAVEAARTAIGIRAGYGKAWWLLADLKNFQFSEADVNAMKAALSSAASVTDRQHLHFALGHAFEQRQDWQSAFENYAKGNALGTRAEGRRPDLTAERVDRAISIFTADFFEERRGFGHESDAPIFIVGLHRSGSTLVEQILGGHSQIEATGELPIVEQLIRSVGVDRGLPGDSPMAKLAHLDPPRVRALGEQYVKRAQSYRVSKKPRFVDKMPSNWLLAGFVHLILPNATIVDARRHPMAAGFSNFRQDYARGASWTYSLESIGRYYCEYLRLMRHFDAVLPGKVHRVIHERLVEDFEPEVRRLLDHVGVDFEPACLEFHRSDRPVRSASAEQVRRPLSREGIDQWRAFEPWLAPLKESLGPALEDWQQ